MASTVFVAVEINAFRYFAPLWRRWLLAGRAGWKVVLGDMAAVHCRRDGILGNLPVSAILPKNATGVTWPLDDPDADRVVVSAGDSYAIERAVVGWARGQGVPSLQVVDTWYNYALRFARATPDEMPDRIGVIDATAVAEATAEGLPADKIVAVGQPAWEEAPALPRPTRKRTLFLGAPVARDFGRTLGYDEWEALDVVRDVAKRRPDLTGELLFGPHPVQRDTPPDRLSPASIVNDSMAALRDVEIVLGMFSSPMVDALLGGRKVISVQPGNVERDMCPLSRHGRIPRARDAASLERALGEISGDGEALRRDLLGSCDRLEAAIMAMTT